MKATRNRGSRIALLLAIGAMVGAILLVAAVQAPAGTYWTRDAGDPGDWGDASNWYNNSLPNYNSHGGIHNGGTARVIQSGMTVANLGLGGGGWGGTTSSDQSGYVVIESGGSLTANGTESLDFGKFQIGYYGTGQITQTGGTATTDGSHSTHPDIYLGYASGSQGTYDLSGGDVNVGNSTNPGFVFVGYSGTGLFDQSGGQVIVAGEVVLGNYSTGVGTYNLDGGTLTTSGLSAGTGTANFNFGGGTLKAGADFSSSLSMTVNDGGAIIDTDGHTMALSGVLSAGTGSGGLTKNGDGTLILSAANTYTGDTILNAGALRATGTNLGTLGTGASQLYLNGGTLELFADTTGTVDYGRDVIVTADTNLTYGRVTSSTGNAGDRRFGALSIGDAKLTASLNESSYTGLDVSATLRFSSTTLTGDAEIDIFDLQRRYARPDLYLGSVTDNGDGYGLTIRGKWYYMRYYATGTASIGGDLVVDGGTLMQDNTGNLTLDTVIGNINLTGNGGVLGLTDDFTRPLGDGSGEIRLSGSYSGFTVNGSNDVVVTLTDGATGDTAQLTWGTGYFNTSALSLAVSSAGDSSSQLDLVNPIDLNGATRRFMTYYGVSKLSGLISNSSTSNTAGVCTNTNAGGTLYLANNQNTFDGPVAFSGTLWFDSIANADGTPSALGAPTDATTNGLISLGYRTTSGTLLYAGSDDSSTDRMISLATTTGDCRITANGAGTISFTNTDPMPTPGAGAKSFILDGANTGDNTFAIGIIDNSSTNTTSVEKSGAGKWILSGANTYSGTTTVSAGTLLFNGTHSGGGDYTVAAGATLGGSGVIGADSTVNVDGILAPGGSLGTLTADGDLVTNAGAIYEWELGDGDQDLIVVGGDLTISDTLTVVLKDAGAYVIMETETLDLFTYGGTLDLGNIVIDTQFVADLPFWDTSNLTIGSHGDSVFITGLKVVPEPSTCLLATLGLLALAFHRGRRRATRR